MVAPVFLCEQEIRLNKRHVSHINSPCFYLFYLYFHFSWIYNFSFFWVGEGICSKYKYFIHLNLTFIPICTTEVWQNKTVTTSLYSTLPDNCAADPKQRPIIHWIIVGWSPVHTLIPQHYLRTGFICSGEVSQPGKNMDVVVSELWWLLGRDQIMVGRRNRWDKDSYNKADYCVSFKAVL